MKSRCVPLATYRLQFNANFGFRDAIGILDYLHDLGISHLYASPILTSRRGSNHGYDVADPTRIDPDLGGEEGFAALQSALEKRGMGLLLDIVPNHMVASSENRWWMDVLEYGPDSPFAFYFDIDWRPPSRDLENKLLLPFLGRPFGQVLDAGEFKIQTENGRFFLRYGDQTFPIAPRSYAEILHYAGLEKTGSMEVDSLSWQEWKGIIAVSESISASHRPSPQEAAERRGKFEQMRERLSRLLTSSPEIPLLLERALQKINGVAGDPRSLICLERILSSQFYRLAFWRTPSESINYRRFFSIADLVGVRAEDPSVFEASHETAIRLGYQPCNTGFRIDHIDGLRDPGEYLTRLRDRLSLESSAERPYLVVEKIVELGESLPEDWPVAGTTGYDFLNCTNRVLVGEQTAGTIEEVYERWTGTRVDFKGVLYEKRKLVMRSLLAVEMRSLGRQFAQLARDDRYARELDPNELMETLIEVTACLPVYRTYVQKLDLPPAAQEILRRAIEEARSRRSNLPSACFDFLSDVLLLTAREHTRPEQREARLAFVTCWQQFTGPVMAKGLEDTALYVFFPLSSLNEVGGDPRVSGGRSLTFHDFILNRQVKWPNSMNATTTHDTKRSEDTRARIAVLSEIPAEWESALRDWSRINEKFTTQVNGSAVPDRNEEYLFYQTLIGTWPLAEADWQTLAPRLQEYVVKATREAMVHTRWTRPNEPHEAALRKFVTGVLDPKSNGAFCACFEKFQGCTALYGMLNGLVQVVLKVASPGVPDHYQGSELWDLRLVDPDNRGSIDFAVRDAILSSLRDAISGKCSQFIRELLENWRDGRVKLYVLAQLLRTRHENPELFVDGDYQPLQASGSHGGRVLAFARRHAKDWAIALTPRCLASVRAPVINGDRRGFWGDTLLSVPQNAPQRWVNVLAGPSGRMISSSNGQIPLGEAFADFPAALLMSAE